jgi:hypothetical protein
MKLSRAIDEYSGLEPNLLDWLKGLEPSIHRYAEHFRELEA